MPPLTYFVGDKREDSMEIVYKKISELIPYENNPRKNDEAVDAVAASISEFGWKVPVVIDTENVVIAGHTRLKAAKKLNIKDIPCIIADDLTEEQIKAFRLADNKVGELAEWDFSKLENEMAEIEIDMNQFGFSEFEFQEEQPRSEKSLDLKEQFQIIIDFADEDELEKAFCRLAEEGYKCRISTL